MSSYRLFSATAPGSKYMAKGWECQDASQTFTIRSAQLAVVADGHGGGAYFRSRQGAGFAVEAVQSQTRLFYEDSPIPGAEMPLFSETGIQDFKYAVWQEWRWLVKRHWDRCLAAHSALGEGEPRFAAVGEKYQAYYTAEDPEVVNRYLYTAYGTTLNFALAIPTQILLSQIGDGTCVVLYRNGTFCTPVPADPGNFLNQVVSLCEPLAYQKMRHVVIDRNPGTSQEPVAVFLTSDGVDDCYPVYQNEQYLYKLYTAVLENILQTGFETTESEIKEELLPTLSTGKGSQDDCSLAYLLCDDLSVLQETYQNIDPELKPAPEVQPPEAEAIADAEEIVEAKAMDEAEEIVEAKAMDEAEEIAEAKAMDEAEEIAEAKAIAKTEAIAELKAIAETEEIAKAEVIAELNAIAEPEDMPTAAEGIIHE